jgi:cytoskeletal protein CcmA (bactofilin family)
MQMDWKRFQDLIQVVVTKAGYRARPVMVGEAGVALISLSAWERKDPEALLCCAPWDQPVVSGRLVAGFHQEMINRGYPCGTMFTPGYYRSDALEFRGERPIELVGGAEFLQTLSRLSAEEQRYLLKLTTAGDYDSPTCPACSVKMLLRDSEMPAGTGKLKNLSIKKSETFIGDVRCNKLTIAKGAEVQFLKGVYANKMTVHGRAVGNFTVSGSAEISQGAWVIGMVAARSVELHPGGVLDGEMKILNEADVQPVRPHPKELLWGCPNYPKCPAFLHFRGRDAPRAAA